MMKFLHFFLTKSYCSYSRYSQGIKNSPIGSVLFPYLDIEERLNNIEKLKESMEKRGIRNVDTDLLNILWKEFKDIEMNKIILEKKRVDVVKKIESLDQENNEVEFNKLKIEGRLLRENLKNMMKRFGELEEELIPKLLMLPNDIDSSMYSDSIKTFFPTKNNGMSHLEISKNLDIIDYISPILYFLKNEAACFELEMMSYFFDIFIKNNFIPISSPDFSTKTIIDICTPDILPIALGNNSKGYYLHGTASLFSFCNYFAKQILREVPVRCITQGRQYENCDKKFHGLFNVCQKNSLHFFIGCSQKDISEEFNNIVNIITDTFKKIGVPFRIYKVPFENLTLSESFKLSFQCHSPFINKYIEVANVSVYNDYISKRLRMYYSDGPSSRFIYVISGTALKIPVLLASYLEYYLHCKI